jgi:hypothetical protein
MWDTLHVPSCVATNGQTRGQQREGKTHHRKKPVALIPCKSPWALSKSPWALLTLKRRLKRGVSMAYKVYKTRIS